MPPAALAKIDKYLAVDQYREFRKKYRYNLVGFIKDCFDWSKTDQKPFFYQIEAAKRLVVGKRRLCLRGPRGLGKTALAAWVIIWFALTRDGDPERDWKLGATASVWRQVVRYLWPEVHKWARRLKWDVIGREPFDPRRELMVQSLKLSTGEAQAVASDDPETIEGMHANDILFIFDESKLVRPATFDAMEGTFSNAGDGNDNEVFVLAISTPGEAEGRFYDIQSFKPGYEDWDVMAVTLDMAIKARAVTREWAEQRKRQWGETSPLYQNHVLGEFSDADADSTVVPLSWIEAANERWKDWKEAGGELPDEMDAVGVDVGKVKDKTVLALRYGHIISELRSYAKADEMQTVGYVVAALQNGGTSIVDVIGIGGGVVSRLRELNHNVIAFNAAEAAARIGAGGKRQDITDKSGEIRFLNKRAAAWWGIRERLHPESGEDICLPPSETLIGDLCAPRWKPTSTGRIKIEAKDDIIERLGRSTDDADAVVQAFWEEGSAKREFFFAFGERPSDTY